MRKRMELISAVAAAVGVAGAVPTAAQAPPDYGHDWATIGDPGNRAANRSEAPALFPPTRDDPKHVGHVGDRYRLSRTEVTVDRWLEFVRASWPYQQTRLDLPRFTSDWIQPQNPDPGPGEKPNFQLTRPDAGGFAANMNWYNAARYANWLHNGKAEARWAFETGVYDLTTLGPHDEPTAPIERQSGAEFWIPSRDEWIKGMYWDPDKQGSGEGGYWQMPDGGDEPLVSAPPEAGGEYFFNLPYPERSSYLTVGQFEDVQSPWGLLDGSGGLSEWHDGVALTSDGDSIFAPINGTRVAEPLHFIEDRLDTLGVSLGFGSSRGLRLASVVPTPGSALALSLGMGTGLARGRRRCAPTPSGGCGGTVSRHRDAAGASGAATS